MQNTETVQNYAASVVTEELDALSRAGLGFDDFTFAAFEVIRRAVPFDAMCMGTVDPATNMLTSSRKVDMNEIGDEEFLFHEYAVQDVAQYSELATRPIGVSILSHETGGDQRASARFREVVQPLIGADHELRGVTRVGGLMWGAYAMYREAGRSAFNAAEADFMQRLEGTMATGIRSSMIVAIAQSADASPSGPAVLIFDRGGDLLHATPTAHDRLAELGGSIDGDLPVAVSTIVSAVRGVSVPGLPAARIGGALVPAIGSAAQAAPHIRARGASGRWFSLHAARFAGQHSEHSQIAVTIEQATPPQVLPLIMSAYGLTDREGSIVQAMLRGESTHAIAQTLFLSPYTVQDHFKSIFEKIGVSSRREVATRIFYGQYLGSPAA
ncbi:LuxR C-terminal-related transcriptional regulator [Planococcus sp. APC 4015]|nr:LuxR C-terminal-related transcriptional regulator [Planococcus sp. APC 4015]